MAPTISESVANLAPTVLIVQADPREAEIAAELIREVARVEVVTADTSEKALGLIARNAYQLVISDCGGPGVDGMAILERVKHLSPSTAVILVSAFSSIEDAVKAIRLGAEDYFKKPFNLEHYKLAVQRCLEKRALYSGDQSVSGLMMLLNACQLISGALEEDKIIGTVAAFVRRETSAKALAVFRVDEESRYRVPTDSDTDTDVVEVVISGHQIIAASQAENAAVKVIPRSATNGEIAVFSFRCAGTAEYFVVCVGPAWATPPEEVGSRFRVLQAQVQMSGRNISNYRGVRHLLYLDEPTGLYNTRYLHHCLDRFFQKTPDGVQRMFSVLFLDVDKFKSVNDQHGHLVGTKLLHEIAQLLRHALRKTDVAFRYGGDEFVAILDGASAEAAREIAERIRQSVEAHQFLARESLNLKLTVSIGVASCPEHAATKAQIIEAADGAMYEVKRSSRNSVFVAGKRAA